MGSLDEVVKRYCAAWDEVDEIRRRASLAVVWGDRAIYMDPGVHLVGLESLVTHIGQVLETYPGSRIEQMGAIDAHHNVFRFSWRKVLADGSSLPVGVDFGELSSDGRIARIVGFFGRSPQSSAMLHLTYPI